MSELTLIVIRIGFLAVLWLFIFIVLYSLRSDLFGPKLTPLQRVAVQSARSRESGATPTAPSESADAPTTVTERASASNASARSGDATRIVITSGPRSGLELDLPQTGLTIGRSSGSGLQIKDDYTSNQHAKIVRWRDQWVVQDLGSTNGTFVEGARISESTPVRVGSAVRIGTTTFELRR
ncbi:Forkhead associated (FHA) domain, binds pSer, pThr, pTyr [Agrococcus baldri]|uniref:Forkhead associated (FHA) domain, binds pSer, pThr, pTyr n=1 Tax=Agrococcus baldri TaxID=153730 RepID=A0AA94KZH7_9MICO|nr:FHA domain-containing protein [Agrococcus baldri]SFS10266.1 Forkhead associated (FHA) domain, binds pSer, pThr, pTyr [Agrococcus baldri]